MTHIHKEAGSPDAALNPVKAPAATGYIKPGAFAMVRADSPATSVMTDFARVSAATIGPDATLAEANQTMISRGVRLLLVVNAADEVVGLITSRDTGGEKPIQLIQERGGKFSDLLVSDLMCPRERIDVIDMAQISAANVGDIVSMLKTLKRQHLISSETIDGRTMIRGVFSATQIGRQLGSAVQTFDVGSTFTEIEGLLSQNA